jgi:hypothetical protein
MPKMECDHCGVPLSNGPFEDRPDEGTFAVHGYNPPMCKDCDESRCSWCGKWVAYNEDAEPKGSKSHYHKTCVEDMQLTHRVEQMESEMDF